MAQPGQGSSPRRGTAGAHAAAIAAFAMLIVIALWAFAWPVRRAFIEVEISANEGWNAYFADAVFGPAPLYPPVEALIANNYPPVSFAIIAVLARWVGDPVLVGRLVSLTSVGAVALWIALAARSLGSSRAGAIVAASWFLATSSRFFQFYVGANEPQMLAHAVVGGGFVLFLRARARGGRYAPAILTMVTAGFVKHTVLAMPLATMAWLAWNAPREALRQAVLAGAAAAVGFAICLALFGHDFVVNMLLPRRFVLDAALGAIGHLQWTAVALLVWLYVGWALRRDPDARFVSLLVAVAFVLFFVLKTGAGVGENAQLDLVIALAIALGLTYTHAPPMPLLPAAGLDARRAALLIALCLRLVATTRNEPVRLVVDPAGFAREVAARSAAFAAIVEQARAAPADAVCLVVLACYRAGKPFVVDTLTLGERIAKGAHPADAVDSLVAAGRLAVIPADPRASWRVRMPRD
ncbi:MAG: hypothetical protein JNL66_07735 [Alphaproteobacteria bacterium]|nr:hypothetical protein [Alphaproteobacteria bacterium]